jgi:hypothetical protein
LRAGRTAVAAASVAETVEAIGRKMMQKMNLLYKMLSTQNDLGSVLVRADAIEMVKKL